MPGGGTIMINKRRIYLCKKDFQSRFILRFVAVATVWAAVTGMVFAYLAGKKLDDLRYSSHFDITSNKQTADAHYGRAQVLSLLIFAASWPTLCAFALAEAFPSSH